MLTRILILATFALGGLRAAPAPAQPAEAEVVVVTRVYDVRDFARVKRDYPYESSLVPPTQLGKPMPPAPSHLFGNQGLFQRLEPQERISEIESLIMDVVATDTWREVGGTIGSIRTMGSSIIVTQTEENHRQIQRLIDQLLEFQPRLLEIEVHWVQLDKPRLEQILRPRDDDGPAGVREVDRQALGEVQTLRVRGRTTCLDDQTVFIASGRGKTLDHALVHLGAMLQVRPALSRDNAFAWLEIESVFSDGRVVPSRSPRRDDPEDAAPHEPDRLDALVHHMRTTVRVPLGRPVLIGGMTLDPREAEGGELYLIVEVTAPGTQ